MKKKTVYIGGKAFGGALPGLMKHVRLFHVVKMSRSGNCVSI
jgi:hypothetical protein